MPRAFSDRYGFLFWMRWITGFAGSFVLSAAAWTAGLVRLFGPIRGEELLLIWTVSVFGTWFILVIPFMRKKEQIWKRLNTDQEKSVDAWLAGFGFFIGAFVASAFGWGVWFKDRLVSDAPGLDADWAKAVFSTWLFILVPLLVWMYRSADRIFKSAHARQTADPAFQVFWIEPEKRLLPERLAGQLALEKSTLPGAHVVHGRLKNGKALENLFVLNGTEVVGAYDFSAGEFDASQLEELKVVDSQKLPPYEESLWVRFNISS